MIEFENVSFSYTGQEHGGLHDINLKISDGECVLFCGRSGCGKTTITRLVNGQTLIVKFSKPITELDGIFDDAEAWGVETLKGWARSSGESVMT